MGTRHPLINIIGVGIWAFFSVVYVFATLIVLAPTSDMQWTVWFALVIGLFVIYDVLLPMNWYFVPNKYVAVVYRLAKALKDTHGEGPIHILWPIERIRRAATFDLKRVRVITIPLGGDKPADVKVRYVRAIRFRDPYLTLNSVPDRDPEIESDDMIQREVVRGFHGETVDTLKGQKQFPNIERKILRFIQTNSLLMEWGVEIRAFGIMDINYPKSMYDAANRVIGAEADATAERIQAEGRKKAADHLGEALYVKLEWIEAVRTAGWNTFVQAGKDLLDLVGIKS